MSSSAAIDKIKVWLFPTMVSIIGIFIWQEIKEIKSDVKVLLAQSNIDKTRIDNLERMIYPIQSPISSKNNQDPIPAPIKLITTEFLPAKNEMEDEEEC
jgi:hypothetical protein